jgi:hypothetical protein
VCIRVPLGTHGSFRMHADPTWVYTGPSKVHMDLTKARKGRKGTSKSFKDVHNSNKRVCVSIRTHEDIDGK